MRIWFGTTTLHFKEYKNYYLKIREHIINKGHILSDDWIGDHGKWIEDNPYGKRDIKNVYEDVVKAMDKAEASIIEFTVPNFSTSHQITYSIQRRIPTLVLRLKRENTFKDSYIDAIESPYLKVVTYTLDTFKEEIDKFLGYAEMEEGQGRYNIVLEKKHKYYLDWASSKYKTSRSSIIKKLIEENMIHDDKFSIYLENK